MNSNNLTTEEQKLLTEWLGECWHEFETNHSTLCTKCNKPFLSQTHHVPRLDFSDWRVVGRLVEKVQEIGESLDIRQYSYHKTYSAVGSDNIAHERYQELPDTKLAICKAVLAYLKEGEK